MDCMAPMYPYNPFFHYNDFSHLVTPSYSVTSGGVECIYAITETLNGPLHHMIGCRWAALPGPHHGPVPCGFSVEEPTVEEPPIAVAIAEDALCESPEEVAEEVGLVDAKLEEVAVEVSEVVELLDGGLIEPSDESSDWPQAEDEWQEVGARPGTPDEPFERVKVLDDKPVCLGFQSNGQPCRHIVGVRPNGVRYPLCKHCRQRGVTGVCLTCDNVVSHQSHLKCLTCHYAYLN